MSKEMPAWAKNGKDPHFITVKWYQRGKERECAFIFEDGMDRDCYKSVEKQVNYARERFE